MGGFLGFPIAGNTRHFLVTYAAETDQDALRRAQAILATCEADLATLQAWFQCNFDQAAYGVWVHVDTGVPNTGAYNYGYDACDSSRIVITGTFRPPQPTRFNIFEDFAGMLFAAEMAEVLMDFTGYGWNRFRSDGEGLSHIAAAELHPAAYYAAGAGNGPDVNGWLQLNPRPDFVSLAELTDKNWISYGCSILFINYLAYQRGFPFSAIVPAARQSLFNIGANLPETFARLTGEPASNAFTDFTALLEQHLPTGEKSNVPRDNIFPLFDAAHRGVRFTVNESTLSSVQQPGILSFTIPTGCMKGHYTYQVEDVRTEMDVEAQAWGYAQPAFSWFINGTPLPTHDNQPHNVSVQVIITDTSPVAGDPPFAFLLTVQYIIVDGAHTSTLKFENLQSPGNCSIDITCGAKEAVVGADPITTHDETWQLWMRSYDMSNAYQAAVYRCSPHPVLEMSAALAALSGQVSELRNSPDPSPEQILALAAQAQRYVNGLQTVTEGVIGLRTTARALASLGRASLVATKATDSPGIAGGLSIRARFLAEGTTSSPSLKVDPLTGAEMFAVRSDSPKVNDRIVEP